VATHTGAPAPGLAPGDGGPVWHTLSADGVLRAEQVDEHSGLSSAEVAARFGPNKFSLDTFSDSKFVIATGVSILTLLMTTVFGPLQAFLKTTSLDVRQWLICLAVALSIVVVSEIQKAVRRHAAPGHQETR
jgi:magnesium-transporting ATPase (P-type)